MDPSETPSGTPPDGVTPNFVNPHSTGYIPRIGIYVFVPLMLVFLALRIGTRVRLARALGPDDITCILAAACTMVFCGLIFPYLGNPLGRHLWDVPLSDLTDRFFQSALICLMFSNLAIMFVKISLLLLYLRIFEAFIWARTAIWSGVVATLIFYLTCDAVLLGVCVSNASQIRMESALTGKCVQAEVKTALAAAWFGNIIDFYILAIPVQFISSLMLNKQRKIGVLAIFLTGLLACAASAANLAQRYKMVYTDITYNDVLFYLYLVIEVNVGIICSCMPLITTPLKVMVARTASSWNSFKQETRALLPIQGTPEHESINLIQNIPNARISALRTFIQRFQRHTSPENSIVVGASKISTLGSFNEEYHQQVKEIHRDNSSNSHRPSDSGSQRQEVYEEL